MLPKNQSIKIGILAVRGETQAVQMWQLTAEYLSAEIPEYEFKIVLLSFEQIHNAIARSEVDFVITNSGIYIEFEAQGSVNRLATLKRLRMGKAYTVFGGTIFSRCNRSDINHLPDLHGKTFMAVAENSLGGWRMAWREIVEAGINPYRDFRELSFGCTQDAVVDYQPIVSLSDRRISGFEALMRWQHPQRGLVYPADFIQVAEETGLLIPMGWWMLAEGCRQLQQWQTQFPMQPALTLSLNLSAKQFQQRDLSDRLRQILLETGLNAHYLKLEITESCLMENADAAAAIVMELKALGVQVYIDDFGTGYSSLSRLHDFHIDALKIDRSFISRMLLDEKSSTIVRTIVILAHHLGMNAIAEGVETLEQLALLKTLHCDYAQGYIFSRPVDRTVAEVLLQEEFATNTEFRKKLLGRCG